MRAKAYPDDRDGGGKDAQRGAEREAAAAEALYALMVAMVRQQPRDMSLTASSTLGTVVRTGPRRVTDLAVLEAVAQPSMTALVSGLERAGLVERRTSTGDQRVVLVVPTPAGESYVQARSRMWAEAFLRVIEKLPQSERQALCGAAPALQRLVELYDEHRANGERPAAPDHGHETSRLEKPPAQRGEPRFGVANRRAGVANRRAGVANRRAGVANRRAGVGHHEHLA